MDTERLGRDASPMESEGAEVGLPEPCPMCKGPGYLEFVDVVHNSKFEACRRCGHRWETCFGTEDVEAATRTLGTRSTHSSLSERLAASRRAMRTTAERTSPGSRR
jgi:hypothetical protein